MQGDSLSCCPGGEGDDGLESASTPSSNTSSRRASQLAQAVARDSPKVSQNPCLGQAVPSPQLLSPPLFVSWSQVADLRGIIGVHKNHEACPYDGLKAAIDHPKGLVPGEKDFFLEVICSANSRIQLCLWKALLPKCYKPSINGNKHKSRGLPFCGQWLN